MKIYLIILIFSFFLICCESKSKRNYEYYGTYKIEQYSDSILLNTAILKINPENKYEYNGKDLEFKKSFFSAGTWKEKNDTLILKTTENKNCYFTNRAISYQCDNFEKTESDIVTKQYFEPNLTVKNCIPKDSSKFYTILTDEKFLMKDGNLTYKQSKNDCSKYLNHIKLKIEKLE